MLIKIADVWIDPTDVNAVVASGEEWTNIGLRGQAGVLNVEGDPDEIAAQINAALQSAAVADWPGIRTGPYKVTCRDPDVLVGDVRLDRR